VQVRELQGLQQQHTHSSPLTPPHHAPSSFQVGVFDTGIRQGHPHIRNIVERTDWTQQQSFSDGLGHGSFVAGVIGSQVGGEAPPP